MRAALLLRVALAKTAQNTHLMAAAGASVRMSAASETQPTKRRLRFDAAAPARRGVSVAIVILTEAKDLAMPPPEERWSGRPHASA